MTFPTSVVPSRKAQILFCGTSVLFVASLAHAASVSFIAPAYTIPIGTSFQIEVHLGTEHDVINAVDGVINIPDGIRITNVETGTSSLQLWPVTPTYKPSNKQILFTGGVPNGLPTQTDELLFKITAIAEKDGAYQFTSDTIHAYQNDGLGTRLSLPPSTVTVNASGTAHASDQISVSPTPFPDLIPPVFAYAEIGRDPSLFNNNYFVTFQANDAESGIDYYEVKEGWFGLYTHANQYYVLQDQTLSTPIFIRAVDKAGNITTQILPAQNSSIPMIEYVFAALVGGVILILILLGLWRARAA